MTDSDLPSTGGCLCGNIRYEISGQPDKIGICHCRSCQKWSGSAFHAGARFPSEKFTITKGEPMYFKSSNIMERGFCSQCGSPFTYRYFSDGKSRENIWVSLGTLDDYKKFKPTYQFAVETEMPWLHESLTRYRLDEDEYLATRFSHEDD